MEIKTPGKTRFPESPELAQLYDALVDELGTETLSPQQAILIEDVVRCDAIKAQLWEDIEQRGVGMEGYVGRTKKWVENKSVATHMKLSDQQRRIMMSLGLIAREKDQADTDDGDGFDEL